MKRVFLSLAASPTLAQIVPENKGYVLSAQDNNKVLPIIWVGASVGATLMLLIFLAAHRRRRRHYRSR